MNVQFAFDVPWHNELVEDETGGIRVGPGGIFICLATKSPKERHLLGTGHTILFTPQLKILNLYQRLQLP